jgi:TrmH family RNA methyltransferase
MVDYSGCYTASPMDPARVDIVLVRPSRAANVAAACRAMKNMGLRTLKLVEPPVGLDRSAARALAYGAWDVLDGAMVSKSLRDAVAESTLVAGTSGRTEEQAWSPRRFAAEAGERAASGRVSVVFGPEASGLTTDELALCHLRIHIPAAAEQPSLNLAQAVLIVAYEIALSAAAVHDTAGPEVPRPATSGELETALDELREALLAVGYLNPANPDALLAELRGLVARAQPTPREVSLVRGIARQVGWAGGRIARGPGGSG